MYLWALWAQAFPDVAIPGPMDTKPEQSNSESNSSPLAYTRLVSPADAVLCIINLRSLCLSTW
jgi:hypothetical protein